jgi:hypothetical protein
MRISSADKLFLPKYSDPSYNHTEGPLEAAD